MQIHSSNSICCLMGFLILIILCVKKRQEGKTRGRKGGVHVPLAQHVKHRKSLSGLRRLLLLLQASLSPDECCVGLPGVKRHVRRIYFVQPPVSSILPRLCSPADIIHATARAVQRQKTPGRAASNVGKLHIL